MYQSQSAPRDWVTSPVSVSRGVNGAALSSGSGQTRPRAPNSSNPKTPNVDRSGLLVVRRNSILGRDGLRFRVLSVRLGFCCVRQVDCNMRVYDDLPVETKPCNHFYVVG